MAITKMLHIGFPAHLKRALDYVFDVEHGQMKTDGGRWVGGNAGMDADMVYRRMMRTKELTGKGGGRQAYHFILSFPKGEATEEIAYQIAQDFCDEYLGDLYDHVFLIHTDKEHMHAHILFNAVSIEGKKYRYKKGDWEKDIQPVINRLCAEHGLSELDLSERKDKCRIEQNTVRALSWKVINREDVDEAILRSDSYEQFLDNMREIGYEVREGYSSKREEPYLSIRTHGMERSRRTYQLGKDYTLPNIMNRIASKEYVMKYRQDLIDHPAKGSLKGKLLKDYSTAYIRIQRMYLIRIGRAYRTYYRYTKPYPQAWKYKKDLIDMQKLIDRYNFLHRNHITDESQLLKKANQIAEAKQSLLFERNRLYRKRDRLMAEEASGEMIESVSNEIRFFTSQIRELSKEEGICRDVKEDLGKVPELEKKLAREKSR